MEHAMGILLVLLLGVEAKLVVFKGFGHGLNKPKAVRAALEQNFEWFSKHLDLQ